MRQIWAPAPHGDLTGFMELFVESPRARSRPKSSAIVPEHPKREMS